MDAPTGTTGTSGRRTSQGRHRIVAVPAVLLLLVALAVGITGSPASAVVTPTGGATPGAASVPARTASGTPRTATHRHVTLVAASLPCLLTSSKQVGGVSTATTSGDSCSTSESGSILTVTFTDVSPPVPACPFNWLQTAHPACVTYIQATGSYSDASGNQVNSPPSLTCPFSAPGQPEPSQSFWTLPWFVYGGTSYTCTVEVNLANLGADATLHVATDDQVLNPDNSVQYDLVNNFSVALVSSATPPLAGLNYHPTGAAADQFAFDGSPSIPAAGATIVSYAWDFGDGTTTRTAATAVTHQYTAEGDRTVTLTVTDSNGLTGSTSPRRSPRRSGWSR